MKSFKTESKKVLDLMINSIYTHKEIFIRELISNASDAIDKLYYKTLSGDISGLSRSDFAISITADKDARTLKIADNGIGMTEKELENNLGTIAKSGSSDFKASSEKKEDINIIGQFGVGFYSAFMVSDKVEVLSKAYGSNEAFLWTSSGTEGYEIKPAEKATCGTEITLYIKKNAEGDENYDEFLEDYKIKSLIKKYSDYIRYPIRMQEKHTEKVDDKDTEVEEIVTVNSMTPIWKKNKNELKKEDYDEFYRENFYESDAPLRVIHTSAEGAVDYKALLFIPENAPYNYYTKSFEKGLKLYTDGVLIMDKCADLLPDYFSFVKGLVDSELTLNISRETIQHNRQLKAIATNLEKKIKQELKDMLENDRESYEKFYKSFGLQLKYGIYSSWGMNTELLSDLLLFTSAKEGKLITLKEYVDSLGADDKEIYYANGKSVEAIKALPQAEKILDDGRDILCMTDDVDEFTVKTLGKFMDKDFKSIQNSLSDADEDKKEDTEITTFMKDALAGKVKAVRFTDKLKTHPVCLTSEGEVSIEMEKVLKDLPNGKDSNVVATKILEINENHVVAGKIKALFESDKDKLKDLVKVLYAEAQTIEGLEIENPTEIADLVCKLIAE